MRFFSLQQFAVATQSGGSIHLLWAHLVQVATPAPQTTWQLFAIGPDVIELLEVVTLRQSALVSVSLHLDGNVADGIFPETWLI
jgi:hypothetical protein